MDTTKTGIEDMVDVDNHFYQLSQLLNLFLPSLVKMHDKRLVRMAVMNLLEEHDESSPVKKAVWMDLVGGQFYYLRLVLSKEAIARTVGEIMDDIFETLNISEQYAAQYSAGASIAIEPSSLVLEQQVRPTRRDKARHLKLVVDSGSNG